MAPGKPYRPVVASILNNKRPRTILDAPAGDGWLKSLVDYEPDVDGIDLFAGKPPGYRAFEQADLDAGIPDGLPRYDALVSCEGIEHTGNPGLFFKSAHDHLNDGGVIVLTTPNIWYPEARLKYLIRGFFPSFPCLTGKIEPGTHMHIMPWSFPQLFLYLKRCGFGHIRLHDIPEKKPRHLFERPLGALQQRYCNAKLRRAKTGEERTFWSDAGSKQAIYGRGLVVSAVRGGESPPIAEKAA